MRLLLTKDERRLMLNVPLACRLGVVESLFIERLRFWLAHSQGYGVEVRGETYIKNTFAQWQTQFPFVSVRTLKSMVNRLEERGIILSVTAGDGYDRTKGYRINWEHPDLYEDEGKVQTLHDGSCKPCTIDSADLAPSTLQKDTEKTPEGSTTTVADVVAASSIPYDREKELQDVIENPKHGPTLARFWQRAMAYNKHALQTQPKMSMKDQKILKTIVERLPDAPAKILDVIENYALFVKFVKDEYTTLPMPVKPNPQKLFGVIDAMAEFETVDTSGIDYDNVGLDIFSDGSDSTNNA